jgi:hypothetical protein
VGQPPRVMGEHEGATRTLLAAAVASACRFSPNAHRLKIRRAKLELNVGENLLITSPKGKTNNYLGLFPLTGVTFLYSFHGSAADFLPAYSPP